MLVVLILLMLDFPSPALAGEEHKGTELKQVLAKIKNRIEQQGSVRMGNGKKSGWRFEAEGCACTYRKVQYLKSGTNYSQIDWVIDFDLADMGEAVYFQYENHAVVLRVLSGEEAVNTTQVKLYRDYTTTTERFRENSVYIDMRNRSDAELLAVDFNRAIQLCK